MSFRKKITFLTSALAGGGAEGVCINIANGLAEKGWDVELLVLNLNNSVYIERVSHNVNLISLNVDNARKSFFILSQYLKRNRVERVLVFNYELAVMLVLIKKITFLRFRLIARNINTLSKKMTIKGSWWRKFVVVPMVNKFYCEVDHVINQCKAMERDLLSVFPQLKGKTSVIYNPVNKNIENFARKVDFRLLKKQDYLLCVGRLEEQKAFHYAIQAFAQLAMEFPELRLKIVGQGSLEKQLKKLTKSLGLEDRVDFEGFQNNLVPYYLHARATLLTSLYEGFPNVLIESITLGTLVVAFDCPSGPNEIIQNGINGYLVEQFKLDAFVDAIRKVCEKDGYPKGLTSFHEKYSLHTALIAYETVLLR